MINVINHFDKEIIFFESFYSAVAFIDDKRKNGYKSTEVYISPKNGDLCFILEKEKESNNEI